MILIQPHETLKCCQEQIPYSHNNLFLSIEEKHEKRKIIVYPLGQYSPVYRHSKRYFKQNLAYHLYQCFPTYRSLVVNLTIKTEKLIIIILVVNLLKIVKLNIYLVRVIWSRSNYYRCLNYLFLYDFIDYATTSKISYHIHSEMNCKLNIILSYLSIIFYFF